ncbi:hypothetical protein [Chryseobacterium sp. R2A-55]|uniref:hypothetical protein n=1 Tax=Chryseobacterium sp. R2A-55 TaxID=2744445 RepID=UPI001F39B42E|nr:hypothetical protein [Chryseobacterium sp. R2A-55]
MENDKIALTFAESKGFISVDFQEKWNGFDVYIAQPEDMIIIGYPTFILVKDGVARENKTSEIYSLMHFTEVSPDTTESLG